MGYNRGKTEMKKTLFKLFLCATFGLLFSSCATIVGGAKYNAHVQVPNHPDAKITVNGQYLGNGQVTASLNRRECDKVSIVVQEGDDEPLSVLFSGRKFRTGTLIADFFLPIPPGTFILDAITGAWWRPDDGDSRITRQDVKNYVYTINYTPKTRPNTTYQPVSAPIPQEPDTNTTVEPTIAPPSVTPTQPLTRTKAEALRELKQLLDEGILTQDEYDKEKAKLLESN